jgi:hypothetical protein
MVYHLAIFERSPDAEKRDQAFLIEGYQAGILGGVQGTKPFLDALKVRILSVSERRMIMY